MKVVNPNDATHTIRLIPRFYPKGSVTIYLYNEANKDVYSEIITLSEADGYLSIDAITYTFEEGDKYQIKITEGSEVVYRGKIFATEQEPQEYSQTEDLYYYS